MIIVQLNTIIVLPSVMGAKSTGPDGNISKYTRVTLLFLVWQNFIHKEKKKSTKRTAQGKNMQQHTINNNSSYVWINYYTYHVFFLAYFTVPNDQCRYFRMADLWHCRAIGTRCSFILSHH